MNLNNYIEVKGLNISGTSDNKLDWIAFAIGWGSFILPSLLALLIGSKGAFFLVIIGILFFYNRTNNIC